MLTDCGILEPDEIRVDAPDEISHDEFQPMINSLHIENFRCFPKLDLENLGQFNIVVGENSAGKTALLESIFLPGGGHDLQFRLRGNRGLSQPQITPVRAVYESLWKDLFFRFSQNVPIVISLRGNEQNSRTLRIFYSPQANTPLFIGFQQKETELANPKTDSSAIIPLTFETEAAGQRYINQAVFDSKTGILQRTGAPPPNAHIAYLPTAMIISVQQSFSELDVKNQKGQLIETIKEVFPIIDDLSLQVVNGVADLYCTIKTLPEKIPIGLVSNGIYKFLTILVTIADRAHGVVLVDEIETGIYYKKFPKMWEAIIKFCKAYDVQLLVSTHSKECLESLMPFIEKDKINFRLIRMEITHDGNHTAQIFTGDEFEAALETGLDPR
jgi:hypothetical protein